MMKAAWDWHMPRKAPQDETRLVAFARELGFDTLVVREPTTLLVQAGRESGMRIIAVLSPRPNDDFLGRHPQCLQQVLPYEREMERALGLGEDGDRQRLAHRWFPLIQNGDLLCYEHDESRSFLEDRVSELLQIADGVALDGFGFKNHYACFCDKCAAAHRSEPARLADYSQRGLVEMSRIIFEHVKERKPEALVINHVWPPFDPNPYYASELCLDYCTQTISWFYRPHWSLQRVELEAAEHKRMENRKYNRFVPFIGLYNDPYQKRSPARLKRELEIALRYGEGSLVLCTLQGPSEDPEIERVVRETLHGK